MTAMIAAYTANEANATMHNCLSIVPLLTKGMKPPCVELRFPYRHAGGVRTHEAEFCKLRAKACRVGVWWTGERSNLRPGCFKPVLDHLSYQSVVPEIAFGNMFSRISLCGRPAAVFGRPFGLCRIRQHATPACSAASAAYAVRPSFPFRSWLISTLILNDLSRDAAVSTSAKRSNAPPDIANTLLG